MSKPLVPHDFQKSLPFIKDRSFVWYLKYNSKTDNRSIGHVNHYSVTDDPRGNLILIPGLASNTATEPLMKSITYWGLTSRYNVYCMDTFLGDFKPEISLADAKKNTYPEYIKLIDAGLSIIEKQCLGQYSCLISHSAGCAAITDVFNDRIENGKKLRFSASIMFAPFISKDWHANMKDFYKHRYELGHLSQEEFYNVPLGLISPHEVTEYKTTRYVSILPQLLDDLDSRPFRPELMNSWNIPITMVMGGKDRKSPPENIVKIHRTLSDLSNGSLFKLVDFPNSKHSFMDQYKDWSAVIRLIKSQRDPRPHRL